MKFSLKIVALALAVAGAQAAVMSNVLQSRQECLPDDHVCNKNNHDHTCCSKYCHSMPGDQEGTCQPKTVLFNSAPPPSLMARAYACLPEGAECHEDGSKGVCCSKNCEQIYGDESGTCGA